MSVVAEIELAEVEKDVQMKESPFPRWTVDDVEEDVDRGRNVRGKESESVRSTSPPIACAQPDLLDASSSTPSSQQKQIQDYRYQDRARCDRRYDPLAFALISR